MQAWLTLAARVFFLRGDLRGFASDGQRSLFKNGDVILADAGYGLSGPVRQALTERGLTWAVGIPYKQKVYARPPPQARQALLILIVAQTPPPTASGPLCTPMWFQSGSRLNAD